MKNRWTCAVFGVAVMAVLFAGFARVAVPAVQSLSQGKAREGRAGARKRIGKAMHEAFPCSRLLVDLNGGACRAVGRRLCNKRIMCRNGVLCESRSTIPVGSATDGCRHVRWLSRVCRERGVPFVVIVAPAKIDAGREMLPRGWDNGGNLNAWAHACCEDFKAEGIEVVDLTSRYTATPEYVRRNFFRTDHHWKISCAFDAAHVAANELSRILGEPLLRDHPYTNPMNWEWRTLKGSFLGSHGRRTGRLFSGLDDIEYAVPLFKTHMSRTLLGTGAVWEGSFEDAAITRSRLEEENVETKYSVVGGGDDALQALQAKTKDKRMRYLNFQAPCAKRVLISHDSYGTPLAAYLSPLFKEMLLNDPRNMPPGLDEAKIISDYRPDVVVRIVYALTLNGKRVKGKSRKTKDER